MALKPFSNTLLPQDLVRLILEYVARNDKQTALRLVLVSRSVQEWYVIAFKSF